VIAFGDGFNRVDNNGYGLSTVQTSETNNTLAGRIAERYGIVVKDVATVAGGLVSTGGFSYATANATVSDVATLTTGQIDTFLTNAGGSVGKKDLIIIAVGNWDIKAAAATNDTAAIDTATTALVAAIQRLTAAGAEHVVVVPSTNMARTPWATSYATTYVAANPSSTLSAVRSTIQNLSNSASTSFNFTLNTKLVDAYRQDRKPVLLLDPTTDYNSFAGSVDVSGNAVRNFSGIVLNNLSTAVCTTASPAAGCSTSVGAGGVINATDYLTSVFADEINLTPVINRYLADRMLFTMKNIGWAP
jgi:phospholipase/lecithinase/hemolysin